MRLFIIFRYNLVHTNDKTTTHNNNSRTEDNKTSITSLFHRHFPSFLLQYFLDKLASNYHLLSIFSMNTAFPPRASRTLGTSSQENASSALVSTGKDSAAASPGFSINRPPLDSLGMNGTGMGLRQRRHDLNGSSSQLPPRESLTMMGASKASSSSTPTTATAASHVSTTDFVSTNYNVVCFL